MKQTIKKSQQEIIGFVLIIVIVSIIGVIFLAITIGRGEPSEQSSIQISNLLEASMYSTTDCVVGFVPQYKDGQDLVKACWNQDRCLDKNEETIDSCVVLEETLGKIISESLDVCDDANECNNKAYNLNIYYSPLDQTLPHEEILIFEEGVYESCRSEFGGSHEIHLTSLTAGTLNLELKVCKN